jgi:hypothetical protein
MPFEPSIAAAAVATLAIAAAIPIPLAQLDFAGLINAFDVHAGDAPDALRTLAAIGGVLTIAVLGIALWGVVLVLGGSPHARSVLAAAALGGLLTAPPFWLPTGILLGAAAVMLGAGGRPHQA